MFLFFILSQFSVTLESRACTVFVNGSSQVLTPIPVCSGSDLTIQITEILGSAADTLFLVLDATTDTVWRDSSLTDTSFSVTFTPDPSLGLHLYYITTGPFCDSIQFYVQVFPRPGLPNITSNSPVCEGDTLFLSGSTISFVTYQWLGPDLFTATTQNAFVAPVEIEDSGFYSLFVVSTVQPFCHSDTAQAFITVFPKPDITSCTAAPSDVCAGDSLSLQSVVSGNPVDSFFWSLSGNPVSGAEDTTLFGVGPSASGIYQLIVVDQNGCRDTAATNLTTVHPNPAVQAICTPNPVCVGSPLTLAADTGSGNAAPPYIFAWSGPSAFQDTGFTVSYQPAAGDSGYYYIVMTNSFGCTASDSEYVSVRPLPVVSALPDTGICQNTLLHLSALGDSCTFLWGNGSTVDFDSLFSVFGSCPVPLTGTDPFGCVGHDTAFVVVSPTPVISTTNMPASICSGTTALVIFLTTGVDSILWSRDNQGVTGMDSAGTITDTTNFLVTLLNSDTLSQTVTFSFIPVRGACQGIAFTAIIRIDPVPVVTVTQAGNSSCSNQPFPTIALSASGSPSLSWTWSPNHAYTTSPTLPNGDTTSTIDGSFSMPAAIGVADTVHFQIHNTDSVSGCVFDTTIEHYVLPIPQLLITASDTSICSGGAVDSITFSTSNGVANTVYDWTWTPGPDVIIPPANDTGSGNIYSATFTYTLNIGSSTALLTVVPSSQSCAGNAQTLQIQVTPALTIPAILRSDTSLFPGQPVDSLCLHASNISLWIDQLVLSQFTDPTLIWDIDPDLPYVISPDSSLIIFQPGTQGTYNVTLDIRSFCVIHMERTLTVSGNASPDTAEVVFHPIANTLVYLDNTVSGYQWGYDDSVTWLPHQLPGEIFQEYVAGNTFDTLARYYWVAAYESDCFNKVYYNYPSGRYQQKETEASGMLVYPNPTSGNVVIHLDRKLEGKTVVEIFTATGTCVLKENAAAGGSHYEISVEDLADGFYFIRLRDEAGTFSPAKVLKSNDRR